MYKHNAQEVETLRHCDLNWSIEHLKGSMIIPIIIGSKHNDQITSQPKPLADRFNLFKNWRSSNAFPTFLIREKTIYKVGKHVE
jgi:hypothetical protein